MRRRRITINASPVTITERTMSHCRPCQFRRLEVLIRRRRPAHFFQMVGLLFWQRRVYSRAYDVRRHVERGGFRVPVVSERGASP